MSQTASYHPSPYSSPRERQRKIDDVDDDKQSTLSHSSGVPRAVQPGKEALRLVAGNRVRHACCAPEYLEEIGSKGCIPDNLRRATSKKFKIISGTEAKSYFKNYFIKHTKRELQPSRTIDEPITNYDPPEPIVFGVTAWDGGRKCVDYYMTWRAHPRAHQSPDIEQKIDRFDTDFRRLARVLDREYKRVAAMKASSQSRSSSPTRRSSNNNSRSRKMPPGITVSSHGEPADKPEVTINPSLPDPPPSAADSVMSLPLLNLVRGVPFSHRVPLRVTNPDRLSMMSDISILPGKTSEDATTAKPGGKVNQEAPNNKLSVPGLSKSKHSSSNDSVKRSSASMLSSDTKSSKSSKSSGSSSGSENHPSHENEGSGERAARRRRTDPSKDEEPIEFMIYLLGDKLDIDLHSWHGLDRQASIRSIPAERHSPWIGPLASQDTTVIHTPQLYMYPTPTVTPDDSDSDSDASENEWDSKRHWKNVPVVPMKPLMEAMGLIPPSHHHHAGPTPVIPGGLAHFQAVRSAGGGGGGSPSPPVGSPYIYPSPRMEAASPLLAPSVHGSVHGSASPYVPAWIPPVQRAGSAGSHASRPASRAAFVSPAAGSPYGSPYASPYVQSHAGPF